MTDRNYRDEIRKRTIRSAPQVGKHHGEGPSDGAQRNARIAAMVADRKAEHEADKEQKIADRTAAAEKRRKETLAMAKEENLDEVRLLKPTKTFDRTELNAALKKHNEDMKRLRAEISAAKKAKAKAKPVAEEESVEEETGTEARTKIKNVARLGDPAPTSEKSTLAKTGEIKVKKVDEEIAESLSSKYGLTNSLIEAAKAIVSKKTQVDMEPKTDDKVDDDSDDKPMGKKKLAKEEEQIDELKKSTLASYVSKASDDATKHSYLAGKSSSVDKAAKASQRIRGIATAAKKLAKEDYDGPGEPIVKKKSSNPAAAGAAAAKADDAERKKLQAAGKKLPSSLTGVKEDVEQVDEASPMIAPPTNKYDSADEAKTAAKKAREAGKIVKVLKHTYTNPRTGQQSHTYSVKEEAEQVDEVLSKKAPAGEWIKDFQKSDNPKFAGKSAEKRKQMALAAYYAKQRNEEVEEVDEAKLSPEDFMKGARRAGTGTDDQLKASASKKNAGPGSGKIRQLSKDELRRRGVKEEFSDEEITRLEEIAKQFD